MAPTPPLFPLPRRPAARRLWAAGRAGEGAGGEGRRQDQRLSSPCDNRAYAVIPSGARNLALSIFKAVRDSSSSANKNGGLLALTRKLRSSHRLCRRGPNYVARHGGLTYAMNPSHETQFLISAFKFATITQ